jgi:hypothetical protein
MGSHVTKLECLLEMSVVYVSGRPPERVAFSAARADSFSHVGFRASCSCGWRRDVRVGDKWPSSGKPIEQLDMVQAWAESAAFVHRKACGAE